MTASSTSSPSRAEARVAVIACGALASDVRRVVERAQLPVDVHLMPALLHNRPREIAPRVEALAARLQGEGAVVAVAYADCGTYGALDEVCERLGLTRLAGASCYELIAGRAALEAVMADEPGTYLLTDFLVATFRRTVEAELGLDRHPELLADYFGNYRRVLWLAQDRTPVLERAAAAIAERLGLALEVVDVGRGTLAAELERLVEGARA